tara:strand:- start:1969 stop:2595 length:627 start_codon:yes stop_codon:yes gene_type:complete
MATLGYVVPEGQQSKEGFHALRRTTEGLLYYTKVNKDDTDTLDYEGGSPTDLNGNKQISALSEYVDEDTVLQSGVTQIFTGDGSTSTFTLTTPVLDGTRIAVFVNGVEQTIDAVWTYASAVVTFKIAPFNGAQVAIGYRDKQYKNNTNDFYHQFRNESGDATYFIDDSGYFVKRENRSRGATALGSDDFTTAEGSTYPVASTSWQSAS